LINSGTVYYVFESDFDLDLLYLVPGSYRNKRIINWLCFEEVLIDFGLRKLFPQVSEFRHSSNKPKDHPVNLCKFVIWKNLLFDQRIYYIFERKFTSFGLVSKLSCWRTCCLNNSFDLSGEPAQQTCSQPSESVSANLHRFSQRTYQRTCERI